MIYVQLKGARNSISSTNLDSVDSADARPEQSVVAAFEGCILRSSSAFAFFMLIALEAGSPIRALLLLLSFPIAWALTHILHFRDAETKLYIFISFAGIRASAVQCVCRAVLPKAYLDDLNPAVHRVFSTCSRRSLITALPRIMVEYFSKEYLGTENVVGSELDVTSSGRCTGFLRAPIGVLSGPEVYRAVSALFPGGKYPDIGIGSTSDTEFLPLCKQAYIASNSNSSTRCEINKPLIFHDGRLVHRPTPLWALTICLWLPFAIPLAIIRIVVGVCLPKRIATPVEHLLGVSVRVRGRIPPPKSPRKKEDENPQEQQRISADSDSDGVLFVLSHRSLIDPVFISFVMGQEVAAVTYSLSRLSELLSPIKTVRLTRCKARDARTMDRLLRQGHLAVCPEGTTCREPFLLRFSALFAELTDRIVPVSLNCNMPVFHGTSARGWKCFDALFFFMNPVVCYEMNFLGQLPPEKTCRGGGMSSHDVANHVQKMVAESLGFQCTSLTRRDKYRILAGNDGIVDPANN